MSAKVQATRLGGQAERVLHPVCARCDAADDRAPIVEPSLTAALCEYADAEDEVKRVFAETLIYQQCAADGRFLGFTDDTAKADWSRVVKRVDRARHALLAHARQVRAAKGSST